jgi:uncharacterized membrane protein
MATVEKSIDVQVPVPVAYGQWTQFEEFPQFMEGVEEVRQIDDTHVHWVAEIGGERHEWDAEIVEQEPDRVIAWRSTKGTLNAGRVEFEPTDEGTRISVEMEYEPAGVKERVGAFFGADEGQVEADLERFRDLIESREHPTDEWRGRVESGRVTDDDPMR